MLQRRDFMLSGCMALLGQQIQQAGKGTTKCSAEEHTAWVEQVLKRMQSIQPGMTRKDLLSVFTTEGGMFMALERTYVSQDCPYFKVLVKFSAVGRPERDDAGRGTTVEDDRDSILSISTPFLQFGVAD